MFHKGQSGNPNGRPKGSLNKESLNYIDIQKFAKLIWDGADKANLTGKEMIELGFRGLNVLLPKVQNLPGTPIDSLANAIQAQAVLKALEENIEIPIEENGVNPSA